jgi:hypothetical protein
MNTMNNPPQGGSSVPCDHRFVYLRTGPTYEKGYRKWAKKDIFYCEKCLEYREVEVETT